MKKSTADREQELLAAIEAGQQARGYAPTRRELAATIGISPARVQQIVASCTRKGLLSCPARTARAFVVISRRKPQQEGPR